jgi:hypothetical protein
MLFLARTTRLPKTTGYQPAYLENPHRAAAEMESGGGEQPCNQSVLDRSRSKLDDRVCDALERPAAAQQQVDGFLTKVLFISTMCSGHVCSPF